MNRPPTNLTNNCRNRRGIVLLMTIVILVVLAIQGYTLTSRVAVQRHRINYIIDYQAARYGCDSAIKYTLATLQQLSPQLISRPNEPDFSDLFHLDEVEYEELLAEWATEETLDANARSADVNNTNESDSLSALLGFGDMNETNDVDFSDYFSDVNTLAEANSPEIRGPYGPTWPLIIAPIEIEIGTVTVRIEIEDENAKYPIGWAMIDEQTQYRQAAAGFETFCEWMDVNSFDVDLLKKQIAKANEIKPFKLDLKPIKKRKRLPRAKRSRSRRSSRSRRRSSYKTTVIPVAQQLKDFVKLIHASEIDTEILARPTLISETRKESALKYMGMWGSSKVNINTAPRNVLEATFVFGGDEVKIAEEIIQRRRIKPFADIKDLEQAMFRYSDSIRKCKKYIITTSRFFTIRVTAVSGVASASVVIAVMRDGRKIVPIAVVSG